MGWNDAQPPYKYKYQAAASADLVVKAGPGYLHGIIIGADVASAVIEVSDDTSDGDGNVKVYIGSDTILTDTHGYLPVGAEFETGICVDQTNQTHCTYIYK